ncbi:MAG: c-type cytochrome [Hymenobacteraceae bacterium]|nr:c-type cytochrome [Hymenobacteraceae bacterium]
MTALHHLIVVAFLLLYAYKIGLLLGGKPDLLAHLRARAPWLDGVAGGAVLLSGGYLALQYAGAWPWWLVVKIGVVLALLPLTVAALRRGHRGLAGATVLAFGYVYGVGYTRSLTLRPGSHSLPRTTPADPRAGRVLAPMNADWTPDSTQTDGLIGLMTYRANCIRCHGRNGDMCLYGARNLQQSTLSFDGRVALLTQGRGRMPAFHPRLSPEQIGAVARYSQTLFRADSATVARRLRARKQ